MMSFCPKFQIFATVIDDEGLMDESTTDTWATVSLSTKSDDLVEINLAPTRADRNREFRKG